MAPPIRARIIALLQSKAFLDKELTMKSIAKRIGCSDTSVYTLNRHLRWTSR